MRLVLIAQRTESWVLAHPLLPVKELLLAIGAISFNISSKIINLILKFKNISHDSYIRENIMFISPI